MKAIHYSRDGFLWCQCIQTFDPTTVSFPNVFSWTLDRIGRLRQLLSPPKFPPILNNVLKNVILKIIQNEKNVLVFHYLLPKHFMDMQCDLLLCSVACWDETGTPKCEEGVLHILLSSFNGRKRVL